MDNEAVTNDIQNSAEIPEHEVSKSPHSVQSPFVESGNTTGNSVETENTGLDLNPGSSRQMCPTEKKSISNETIQIPIMTEQNLQSMSLQSIPSYVCRICHNCENPDKLVSPCLCRGSLIYVHIHCLERWISMSRCTSCELCQFQYNTQQTLRYSLWQSLRIWYSRSMSRRALQEDCQMFSLLTLVAFGIIGTLLVAVQYYILQGHLSNVARLWSKGWLIFLLFATLAVYLVNVYMIAKSHLTPWYRWWQSARDIRLILENHRPYPYTGTQEHFQKHLQPEEQQQQQHQDPSQHQNQQSSIQTEPIEERQTQTTSCGRSSIDTMPACQNNFAQSRPQDIDNKQTNNNSVALMTSANAGNENDDVCNVLPNPNVMTTAVFILLPIDTASDCIAAATFDKGGGGVGGGANVLIGPYNNGCHDIGDVGAVVRHCNAL